MPRSALYSRSRPGPLAVAETAAPAKAGAAAEPPRRGRRLAAALRRPDVLWAAIAALGAALVFALGWRPPAAPPPLTQDDIDAAVLHTLQTKTLPSQTARAAAAVAPSLVRVEGLLAGRRHQTDRGIGVGTGVVIVDDGTILTNLHVVRGATRITVTFADGQESPAKVVGAQPENDLAVLRAARVPDDLRPATLRATGDLMPGDQVAVIGFPFDIGPSVSAGVVSGLQRAFRSPEGKQEMTNLIQFDAAANPGNSGGPLVTMDGEVVGIVTAILNPTPARTFVGIGFAVPIENAASAIGLPPF